MRSTLVRRLCSAMPERRYSSRYLCDLTIPRIGVECRTCGMTRSYDRQKLMARLEELDHQCLPSLLRRLAEAEGCRRHGAGSYSDPCQLKYDATTQAAWTTPA